MATGLEEPGGPWFGQPADPGSIFLNAFAKMSAVNNQKMNLERQLMMMQAEQQDKDRQFDLDKQKFGWQQQFQTAALQRQAERQLMMMQAEQQDKDRQFDLDKQKFGWQQQFQTAALQRQADAERSLAVYRDRMATTGEDRLNWTLAKKDADAQNAGQLRDELTGLVSKYSGNYGSQEFANEYALAKDKYATVTGTPDGARVLNDFNRDITNSQNQAHKSADLIRKNFDASLAMTGGNFNRQDFLQPDNIWQTDKTGSNRFLPRVAEPIPGTNNIRWRTVSPKEVKDLSDAGKGANIRYDTMPASSYDSLRKMHDRMLEIGGPDLSQKPAMTVDQRVRVKDPNGNSGTLPASQLNDALAAGWSQE